jgi:hypothetical protein
LEQISQTDTGHGAWDFLSYMQRNELANDEANRPIVEALGQKIGLNLSQRIQIVKDLRLEQSFGIEPYLQFDTIIQIRGLPGSATVDAMSDDRNDRVTVQRVGDLIKIYILGAQTGFIGISSTYDEYGKLAGRASARWSVTTAGRSYAQFNNQFGFLPHLPVGSWVDDYGDINIVSGDRLGWAKKAYSWALEQPNVYTDLSGVRSGIKEDIDDLISDYRADLQEKANKLIDLAYGAVENAYEWHVQKNKQWDKFQVQSVFQSAIKLSTLLTNEINLEPGIRGQINPEGRADEYTASVTRVLLKHIPKSNTHYVSETLASAMLSPVFQTLVKEAKGLARETIQNAYLVLSAFDPEAAAAVLQTEMIARGTANNRAFLPSAKRTDDPNSYVAYLTRRLLTEKNLGPPPDQKALKDATIWAATVYAFGAIRELVPAAKLFTLTPSVQKQIITFTTTLGKVEGTRTIWTVPDYAGRSFEQNAIGAYEHGIARYAVGINLGLTTYARGAIGERLKFLDHTNSWMPIVSLVLRANQFAAGYNVLSTVDKSFICARMVADLMSFAGYVYERRAGVSAIARKLGVSAASLLSVMAPIINAASLATNYLRPLFAGFRFLRFDLSALDLSNNSYIRPLVKVLMSAGKVSGELVGELADVVYGGVNIVSGSLQIAKGNLIKGGGLLVYGVVNFASGTAFTVYTVRGIVTKQYHWAVPFRAASFWLQITASLLNGYLCTVSSKEASNS